MVSMGEVTATHTKYSDWRKGSRNRHGGRTKTWMSNRLPHGVEERCKFVDTVLTLFKVSIEATCPSHERNPVFSHTLLKVSWRAIPGFETKGKIS